MEELQKLLGRFKKLLGEDTDKRNLIIESIRQICHLEVSSANISIKGTILRLDVSSIKKSELKLHESEILGLLLEKGLKIDKIL